MKKSTSILIGFVMGCSLLFLAATPEWIQYNERVVGENSPWFDDVVNRPGKQIWGNFTSQHGVNGDHKAFIFPTPLPTATPIPDFPTPLPTATPIPAFPTPLPTATPGTVTYALRCVNTGYAAESITLDAEHWELTDPAFVFYLEITTAAIPSVLYRRETLSGQLIFEIGMAAGWNLYIKIGDQTWSGQAGMYLNTTKWNTPIELIVIADSTGSSFTPSLSVNGKKFTYAAQTVTFPTWTQETWKLGGFAGRLYQFAIDMGLTLPAYHWIYRRGQDNFCNFQAFYSCAQGTGAYLEEANGWYPLTLTNGTWEPL